jgi:hypothetical protein
MHIGLESHNWMGWACHTPGKPILHFCILLADPKRQSVADAGPQWAAEARFLHPSTPASYSALQVGGWERPRSIRSLYALMCKRLYIM